MKEVERGAGIITYTLSNENKPLFLILKEIMQMQNLDT